MPPPRLLHGLLRGFVIGGGDAGDKEEHLLSHLELTDWLERKLKEINQLLVTSKEQIQPCINTNRIKV